MNSILVLLGIGVVLYLYGQTAAAAPTTNVSLVNLLRELWSQGLFPADLLPSAGEELSADQAEAAAQYLIMELTFIGLVPDDVTLEALVVQWREANKGNT
jgi:hypothetical protein